ncbi:MAG: hypothetical protein LBR10_05105 [Prevotellaceae bacterium]|jgi:hypothetical protein|nr:hypothetical protein [Prevotellaceae bacterium]
MINKNLNAHKNLAIFTIQGNDRLSRKYVTLEEAMDKNLIVLHETGNVGELSIDNKSEHYVFLLSGDIVKGGRQDRTIAEDVILKPGSENVPLKSFCVEQSRWHRRGHESDTEFSTSKKSLSNRHLKIAAREKQSQHEVWAEVASYQESVSTVIDFDVRSKDSASSLQLTLDNDELQKTVKEYFDALHPAFDGKTDAVGFAFCINGKISTVETFGSAELFGKLQDKLLESAASEAVFSFKRDLNFEHPTADNVEEFIIAAKKGEMNVKNTGIITFEKRYRTSNSILFKTYHSEAGTEEKVHSVAYSTDEIDVSGNDRRDYNHRNFRYGGINRNR